MSECTACGVEFSVRFEEPSLEVRYCPLCGEEQIEELDFDEE